MKFLSCILLTILILHVYHHETKTTQEGKKASLDWLNRGIGTKYQNRSLVDRNAAKRQSVPAFTHIEDNAFVDGRMSSNYQNLPRDLHETITHRHGWKKSFASSERQRNIISIHPHPEEATKRSLWSALAGETNGAGPLPTDPFVTGRSSLDEETTKKISEDLASLASTEAKADSKINLNADLIDLRAKFGVSGPSHQPSTYGNELHLESQHAMNMALDDNISSQDASLQSISNNGGERNQEQSIFNSIKHKLDKLTDASQITDGNNHLEYGPSLATAMPTNMMDSIYSLAGYPLQSHTTQQLDPTSSSVQDITGPSIPAEQMLDTLNENKFISEEAFEKYLDHMHTIALQQHVQEQQQEIGRTNSPNHVNKHTKNNRKLSASELAESVIDKAVSSSKISNHASPLKEQKNTKTEEMYERNSAKESPEMLMQNNKDVANPATEMQMQNDKGVANPAQEMLMQNDKDVVNPAPEMLLQSDKDITNPAPVMPLQNDIGNKTKSTNLKKKVTKKATKNKNKTVQAHNRKQKASLKDKSKLVAEGLRISNDSKEQIPVPKNENKGTKENKTFQNETIEEVSVDTENKGVKGLNKEEDDLTQAVTTNVKKSEDNRYHQDNKTNNENTIDATKNEIIIKQNETRTHTLIYIPNIKGVQPNKTEEKNDTQISTNEGKSIYIAEHENAANHSVSPDLTLKNTETRRKDENKYRNDTKNVGDEKNETEALPSSGKAEDKTLQMSKDEAKGNHMPSSQRMMTETKNINEINSDDVNGAKSKTMESEETKVKLKKKKTDGDELIDIERNSNTKLTSGKGISNHDGNKLIGRKNESDHNTSTDISNTTEIIHYKNMKSLRGEEISKNENGSTVPDVAGTDANKSQYINYSDKKHFPLTNSVSEKAKRLPKSFNDEVDFLASIIMTDMTRLHQANESTNAMAQLKHTSSEPNKNDIVARCPENKLCSNESPIEVESGNTSSVKESTSHKAYSTIGEPIIEKLAEKTLNVVDTEKSVKVSSNEKAEVSDGIESPLERNQKKKEGTALKKTTFNRVKANSTNVTNNKTLSDKKNETTKETPAEATKETPTEATKETPTEATKEPPTEATKETPTEATKETPTEATKETPTEATKETPTEATKETSTEATKEAVNDLNNLMNNKTISNATNQLTKDTTKELAKESAKEKGLLVSINVSTNNGTSNEDSKTINETSRINSPDQNHVVSITYNNSEIDSAKRYKTPKLMSNTERTENSINGKNKSDGLSPGKMGESPLQNNDVTSTEIMEELKRIEGSVLAKAFAIVDAKRGEMAESSRQHWTEEETKRFSQMNDLLEERILQRINSQKDNTVARKMTVSHSEISRFDDRVDRLVAQLRKSALFRKRNVSFSRNIADIRGQEKHTIPHPLSSMHIDENEATEITRKNVLAKGLDKADDLINILSGKDVKPEFAGVLADITTYDIRAKNRALGNLPPPEEDPYEAVRRETLKKSLHAALKEYMAGANKEISHAKAGIKKYSYLNLDNTLDERRDLELINGKKQGPVEPIVKTLLGHEENAQNNSAITENGDSMTKNIHSTNKNITLVDISTGKQESDSSSNHVQALRDEVSINNKPQVTNIKVNSVDETDGNNLSTQQGKFNSSRALLDILDLNEALTNIIKMVQSSGKEFSPEKLLLVRSILRSMNSFYTEIEKENSKSIDKTNMQIRGILKSNILKNKEGHKTALIVDKFNQMQKMINNHRLERIALQRGIMQGFFIPDDYTLKDYDINLKETLSKKDEFQKLQKERLKSLFGHALQHDADRFTRSYSNSVFRDKHNATKRTLDDIIVFNSQLMEGIIRNQDEEPKPLLGENMIWKLPRNKTRAIKEAGKIGKRDKVERFTKQHIFHLIQEASHRMRNMPTSKHDNEKRNKFVEKMMKSVTNLYSSVKDAASLSYKKMISDGLQSNERGYIEEKKGIITYPGTGSETKRDSFLETSSSSTYRKYALPIDQDVSTDSIDRLVYEDTAAKKLEIPNVYENNKSSGKSNGRQLHIITEEEPL